MYSVTISKPVMQGYVPGSDSDPRSIGRNAAMSVTVTETQTWDSGDLVPAVVEG